MIWLLVVCLPALKHHFLGTCLQDEAGPWHQAKCLYFFNEKKKKKLAFYSETLSHGSIQLSFIIKGDLQHLILLPLPPKGSLKISLVLESEPRAFCILGKHSAKWATWEKAQAFQHWRIFQVEKLYVLKTIYYFWFIFLDRVSPWKKD